ncbi:hypothetical protein ATANTOWER_017363 [Ataeniobius toweri]|uniref:Uncharacterized protein n=1 Tax=Ataeniobius toweri TaxID=208326 RepID=A0ABU7C1F9_9TELE|nr:hypothetical protein [Ataeniobius toweri]
MPGVVQPATRSRGVGLESPPSFKRLTMASDVFSFISLHPIPFFTHVHNLHFGSQLNSWYNSVQLNGPKVSGIRTAAAGGMLWKPFITSVLTVERRTWRGTQSNHWTQRREP